MARLAAVFPNEGSHYVGMGKDFYAKSLTFRKRFDDAEKFLRSKIAKVCFLGPKEDQDKLPNAHLINFLTDAAIFDLLVGYHRKPEALTGVGVGEIAALTVAECLPFLSALRFVVKRAELVQAFAEKHGGASLLLSGLSEEQLRPLLQREEGELIVTQTLSPETFMVWGPQEAVESLESELKAVRQVKLGRPLPRGPLFSPKAVELEGPLSQLLDECLGEEKLKMAKIPCYASGTGERIGTLEGIRDVLVKQYSRPVQWVKTVQAVIFDGFRTWVEVGPGRFYTTMVKKIDVDTRNTNVEDAKSLSAMIKVTG